MIFYGVDRHVLGEVFQNPRRTYQLVTRPHLDDCPAVIVGARCHIGRKLNNIGEQRQFTKCRASRI